MRFALAVRETIVRDTIARRFAFTIVLSIVVTLGLAALVVQFAGVWARPSAHAQGLLERANDMVRMIEAAPASQRKTLADAVANPVFTVNWYPATSPAAVVIDAAERVRPPASAADAFDRDGTKRRVVHFRGENDPPPLPSIGADGKADRYVGILAVALDDGSWVTFTALNRTWGLSPSTQLGVVLVLLTISIIGVSAIATHSLVRPITAFTGALRRFGTDPRASPIEERGPVELRQSIGAFNAMQAQIQRFVDDRTTMLAAISHDLRTPLTRVRLRAEFVDDERQKSRLFRDVDEMQAMVEAALAFFRDDVREEDRTAFDLPDLLQAVADDYTDQGHEIVYGGTQHLRFVGRPFALRRAFANLMDNAVKYGAAPRRVTLRREPHWVQILISDSGPGIPAAAADRVFSPFYRLETSRSRATGGVGLGLTSARAVILAHGGEIALANQASGGLVVTVSLPFDPADVGQTALATG